MSVDYNDLRRHLNPLALGLKKMELEVKCPICLDFLRRPTMLPCNHVFCSDCIDRSTEAIICPSCDLSFHQPDLRSVNIVEAIISIFKGMNTSFLEGILQRGTSVDASGIGLMTGNVNKSADVRRPQIPGDTSNKPSPQKSLFGKRNRINSTGGGSGELRNLGDHVNTNMAAEEKGYILEETKDSNIDTIDQGSEHMVKMCSGEASPKSDTEIGNNKIGGESLIKKRKTDDNDHCKDVKCGEKDIGSDIFDSDFNYGIKWHLQSKTPDPCAVPVSAVCAFCHSSRVTEASGPMQRYANGDIIPDAQPMLPEALHVHMRCIEWAPRVYFVGESVKNLEAEISRAAKIKCSSCGLKGAALGCNAKSCRKSFHVPCAFEIPGARWDSDEFMMLCPAHSSRKLPCDKTKSGVKAKSCTPSLKTPTSKRQSVPPISPLEFQRLFDLSKQGTTNSRFATPRETSSLVFSGSGLTEDEKELLDSFARLNGAVVSKGWKGKITHVIASTDESGACGRTLKVLKGILEGKWVVRIDWVKACMDAGCIVEEEPYEIAHDVCGSFGGPRKGRLRAMNKEPSLFAGMMFYFYGDYDPSYKRYLEDLVACGGGSILGDECYAHALRGGQGFIVYCSELLYEGQGDSTDGGDALKRRAEAAGAVAVKIGFHSVGHACVLDSVSAYDPGLLVM